MMNWPTTGMLVLTLWVTGCGYSTRRPFPEGIRTVHVEMAQSREFRRDLEFDLTEALVKRIEMDTPYAIADARDADTVLTCEILEVRTRGLADEFRTRRPREVAASVFVRLRWKDQRTGKTLLERPRFGFTTSYLPSVGETFRTGSIRAMDGLAEQIVEAMESSW